MDAGGFRSSAPPQRRGAFLGFASIRACHAVAERRRAIRGQKNFGQVPGNEDTETSTRDACSALRRGRSVVVVERHGNYPGDYARRGEQHTGLAVRMHSRPHMESSFLVATHYRDRHDVAGCDVK